MANSAWLNYEDVSFTTGSEDSNDKPLKIGRILNLIKKTRKPHYFYRSGRFWVALNKSGTTTIHPTNCDHRVIIKK